MASNPLVAQGTLNRALTSIAVIGNPALNIISGFFSQKVASITFEGETSDYIPTLTGGVPSGRLYQFVTITAYILKSQGLANLWEQQRLTNSNLGDVNFVTDANTLQNYYLYNAVLMNISNIDATGDSADFPLTIRGTYPINSDLFQ